ncbi:hypothetical protein C0989_006160 [Termitomyces sp. Mn162]|nr:hypothetical protein C0989_006160 [Termitomyces sp. Mn162]
MMHIMHDALKLKLAIKKDRDINKAVKNGQHMALPVEADSFDHGDIPAPTLTPFHPYWDEICCLWNGSLADQFIDELHTNGHDFNGETRKALKDYFFQCLTTLRKELKHQVPRPNETIEQAQNRANAQYQAVLARNCV